MNEFTPHGFIPKGAERRETRWRDGGDLVWLYIDMNSYFASCAQHDNVDYRGRPLIVVPTMTNYTSAIAASYQAKALGIKTGTSVLEARQKCPDIIVVEADPRRYFELHNQIKEAVDRVIPIELVCSIDEFACRLMGPQKLETKALKLALDVQQSIMHLVGPCLTSSVGLAPSILLAKTGADMKKPLGVTLLRMDHLPKPMLNLEIDDFAGIGPAMGRRLRLAGINDVETLWALSPSRMRQLWGGVVGENFWYALHGHDTPRAETTRSSIGHSHVLAPALRPKDAAYHVARYLVTKCANRLRQMDYKTPRIYLSLRGDGAEKSGCEARFDATYDTFKLLKVTDELWQTCIKGFSKPNVKKISVTCLSLVCSSDNVDLFGWSLDNQENLKNMNVLNALDRINQRYGKNCVTIGPKAKVHQFVGEKIAFTRVPSAEEFNLGTHKSNLATPAATRTR